LAERIGETKLTAECADNVTREFKDLEALLRYENVKAKRILNLDLAAHSPDWKKTARVSFSDKWYFGGTSVSVEARDDVVGRLRTDLLDVLSGIRPWYWPVNKIDFFFFPVLIYWVLWIALLVYGAWRESKGTLPPPTNSNSPLLQLAFLGFIASLAIGGYTAHRLRRILFPHGTFLIGQEEQRFDTLEKWRWGFGVAVFASVIASLLLLPFV